VTCDGFKPRAATQALDLLPITECPLLGRLLLGSFLAPTRRTSVGFVATNPEQRLSLMGR